MTIVEIQCQYCQQLMSEQNHLDHLQECKMHCRFIMDISYGYECQLCSFESDAYQMVSSHLKASHSKQIVLSWTIMKNGLKKFFRKEKTNGSRLYFCNLCHEEQSQVGEMVFHVKELHSDETKKVTFNNFNSSKDNVCPKNQAISKDIFNKPIPKTRKRKRFDKEVGLLRTVLERTHLQSVEMSQEFKNEEEENKKRKLRKVSQLRIVLERTHHRFVAKNCQKKPNEDEADIGGLNDYGIDTSIDTDKESNDAEINEEPRGKKLKCQMKESLRNSF